MFVTPSEGYDWRVPLNNDLWQGVSGINNPCPAGFRLPTATEWDAERASWVSDNALGAYASSLKLVMGGARVLNGTEYLKGTVGWYWTSTLYGVGRKLIGFNSTGSWAGATRSAAGYSVRCIKN